MASCTESMVLDGMRLALCGPMAFGAPTEGPGTNKHPTYKSNDTEDSVCAVQLNVLSMQAAAGRSLPGPKSEYRAIQDARVCQSERIISFYTLFGPLVLRTARELCIAPTTRCVVEGALS